MWFRLVSLLVHRGLTVVTCISPKFTAVSRLHDDEHLFCLAGGGRDWRAPTKTNLRLHLSRSRGGTSGTVAFLVGSFIGSAICSERLHRHTLL